MRKIDIGFSLEGCGRSRDRAARLARRLHCALILGIAPSFLSSYLSSTLGVALSLP